MTGQVGGVTPVVLFITLFAVVAVLILSHTTFGRRVMAVGNSPVAARLAAVLLLTALQTLLTGSNLPTALRAILYGLVVLGAVIALRERRAI